MNGPHWDTRSSLAAKRAVGRDRLALILGVSLLVIVGLAVLTSKVLALNPPTLAESSPTADHIEQKAPVSSPEPPDPESLFLDLPDPPPTPKASASDTSSKPANSSQNLSGDKGSATPGAGGSGDEAAAMDVPVKKSDFKQLPAKPNVEPGSGSAQDLLADPDCRFSDVARRDLEVGIVDEYLISALQAVCEKHSIYVNVFKTGHTFGPGLAEGPTIPTGYGNAGGYPNTHYFGRAADIWEVDGKPVEGNGSDPSVVSVGKILAGLPTTYKPDVVIGPYAWNQALGYGPEQGWVIDGDQVALHADHLHVGYWEGDGTPPPQVFMSPVQVPSYTSSAPVRRTSRDSARAGRSSSPDPKEPVERRRSVPGTNVDSDQRTVVRQETSRQTTVTRRVERPRTQSTIQNPKPKESERQDSADKSGDSRQPKPRQPEPDREARQPDRGEATVEDETNPEPESSTSDSPDSDDEGSEATSPADETTGGSTNTTD